MKIYTTLILLSFLPIYGAAQFNTVTQFPKISVKKDSIKDDKSETLSKLNNEIDSLSWRMVYEQFAIDRSGYNNRPNQFRLYLPLRKIEITSLYGMRFHPLEKKMKMHDGVDLKAYYEPVYCIADGIVKSAGYGEKEGYYVLVLHGDVESVYCHLSLLECKVGQFAKGGTCIGISGNSGNSTGPHLHFGINYKIRPINPISFF